MKKKAEEQAPDQGKETSTQQVLIRATPTSHQRWKEAAELTGVTMSEFIRDAVDAAAAELLDCPHDVQYRRWYPWAEVCLKCGNPLRERDTWLVDPQTFPHVKPLSGNPALYNR
jgi:hypothetical protein